MNEEDSVSSSKNKYRTFFVHENGDSMVFYMTPSREKADLRSDILNHGGRLALTTERDKDDVIKLAVEGAGLSAGASDFFSINFIKDCVENDKRLDLEDYRLVAGEGGRFFSKVNVDYQNEMRSEFEDLMPSDSKISCGSKSLKGRRKYLVSEDVAIIKYLVENSKFNEVSGRRVWTRMENMEVTNHSWQSMKDRYLKIILPNVKSYDLPSHITKKLAKYLPDYKKNAEDDFDIETDETLDSYADAISVSSSTDETLLQAAAAAESKSSKTKQARSSSTPTKEQKNKGKAPIKHLLCKKTSSKSPNETSRKRRSDSNDEQDRIASSSPAKRFSMRKKRSVLSTTENSSETGDGDNDAEKSTTITTYFQWRNKVAAPVTSSEEELPPESVDSDSDTEKMETAIESLSSGESVKSPSLIGKRKLMDKANQGDEENNSPANSDAETEGKEEYWCLDSDDTDDEEDAQFVRLSKSESGEVMEELQSTFGLDSQGAKKILWVFNGNVESAIAYLNGADLPFWTREDDETLCSGQNLESLDKFTRNQREARLAFLKPVQKTYLKITQEAN